MLIFLCRGAEIPDLPLSELIFRALVHFLHSGCYVDCRLIAQSHSLAESRALNALHQQATAEDFAFHYGEFVCCWLLGLWLVGQGNPIALLG